MRVHDVVVPRPAGEGQPAGAGELAIEVEPERRGAELHRRREARVEVDEVDVVDADARRASSTRCPAELDRRRLGERVPVGDVVVLVAVGAGVDEDPSILGTPSGRARSTEHMMSAAAMSTSLFEFMYFRYGKPIIRLPRRDGRRSPRPSSRRWIHAYGLAAATAVKRAHSSLILRTCASTVSAGGGPDRGLEHRVHLHRQEDAPGDLARVAHLELLAEHDRRLVVRRLRPLEVAPALRARIRVRHASPPARMATSSAPASRSRRVRLTSVCGLLPPAVV